jgi:hypothetical protein
MSAQSRQWKFARSVSDLLALIGADGGGRWKRSFWIRASESAD